MNHSTQDTAGRVFPDRKTFEEHRRQKEAILSPKPPRPRIEAIKIISGGRMFAGKRRDEGDILLVMPQEIPPGFVSKEDARDLVDNAYAAPATAEELAAFLDAQKTQTTTANQ